MNYFGIFQRGEALSDGQMASKSTSQFSQEKLRSFPKVRRGTAIHLNIQALCYCRRRYYLELSDRISKKLSSYPEFYSWMARIARSVSKFRIILQNRRETHSLLLRLQSCAVAKSCDSFGKASLVVHAVLAWRVPLYPILNIPGVSYWAFFS